MDIEKIIITIEYEDGTTKDVDLPEEMYTIVKEHIEAEEEGK